MTRNAEVARLLEEYADLLEAQDDEYRPRSYRRAAENIRDHPDAVEALAEEGPEAVQRIEGVGESIAGKVVEYLETGRVERIEEAREALPVNMRELTSVEGVGPKTVADLYEGLGITTLHELEAAATAGEIRTLRGFGETTEDNILRNIPFAREVQERELLGDARPLADDVVAYLDAGDAIDRCDVAGSLRRWRETIGDVDVLAAATDGGAVVDRFVSWDAVDEVIEAGTTKAGVRARDLRVDLRVVAPGEWGAALQYFTGSRDHNIRLRNYAIARDRKVNEYGVFDVSDVADPDEGQRVGTRVAGETEESVYAALDLPWIPPELREDAGEIDAASAGDLPSLVEEDDVAGDLHVHTEWSDGADTIEDIAAGAAAAGLDYLGISDHATGPGIVSGMGLTDDDLREQRTEVERVNETADVELLAGVEANITADGEVTVDDAVAADLDLVIASPHNALDGDGTDRVLAAIEHPHVDVIGHPTGRLLNRRPGMDLDHARIAEAAAETGTALEVNANPNRLDLRGDAVRAAVDAGARIAINTDAHSPEELQYARYGVHTARRGWATPRDVVTTWPEEDVRGFLS